jgi:PAS domain S-box-containing protein
MMTNSLKSKDAMQRDHFEGGKTFMKTRPSDPARQVARHSLLGATIVFLVVATAAATLVWKLEQHRLQEYRARVLNLAGDSAYDIQRRFDRAFSATYALAALIRQGHGSMSDFDAVAYQMLPFYPGVSALGLAPRGVVQAIVPLAGNEGVIGHDMLGDPARTKESLLARDTGKLTLAGPFELVQGGVGAVARLPVFFDGKHGKPDFWGFTTVLIRFPKVLDQTLLSQLDGRGFAYELWRLQPDTGKKQVIAKSASLSLAAAVEYPVQVPNGTWTLSMAPVKGWGDPVGLTVKIALGLLFSLLLAWLAKLLIESKAQEAGLEALIVERTADLEKSTELLRDELDARIMAEESLHKQKKFTENLIDNSAAATFVLNPQHKVILWNKACAELTGISSSALIGTGNHWQAFYDHERPCIADIVLDAGNDRLSDLYDSYEKSALVPDGLHAEGWYQNMNGRDRYIMFDAAPVYDPDGVLVAAIETLQEVTESKRAEADLHLQSAALQAAANSIVITDKSGTIEWVNPAFTMLTGYSAEEAIGRNPRELVKSGVHDQAFFKRLWDTILKGDVWRGQIINRHKDGILYPEGQTITPVKDANGEITHFIAIKRDLTEQRKLEEQLHHAQRMESIGTLAGGIAHDFNNILSAIIGYGQFSLLKMPADDPLRHNIESMLEAADRAARLTRELLTFSRKQPIDKKPVDLNLVVAKVEKFLRKVIGEDITYSTIIHEAPLPVLADGHQLEQVLMNLATNARDSMPKGGALTVATENILLDRDFVSANGFLTPGPYALITVSDTGEGMEEATRQRIFEPFFTTKDVGKGTGLGLAVTYGIIKQHDGYINVYSEPGEGATFRIYLPLIPRPDVGEEPPVLQEEAPAGGTETILLAEDDEDVRVLTKRLLMEFGYAVIEAVDGEEAVSKFTENRAKIDLILTDLIMPKMNGKEAVDEIRKIHPGIKVIFSSGYAPDTIQQKAELTDGCHLIVKPVSPRELLRKVRSVLDGNG